MALQSQFFRGDPKLEAAAVVDSAHILPGASGTHVKKIQSALFVLDGAQIDPREFEQSRYGTSTAQAVLRYKQRRKIINRSYQSQADNIVGRMTMASLDKEMLGKNLKFRRKGCDYAPKFSSGLQLNFAFSDSGPQRSQLVGGIGAGIPQPPPTPLDLAIREVPRAFGLANKTLKALNAVIDNDGSAEAQLGSQAIVRHYKVTTPSEIVSTAKKVKALLLGVTDVLIQQKLVFKDGLGSGFAETPHPRRRIFILPGYVVAGKIMRPLVLIHECFHFTDEFHEDFGGNPARDQGARYHKNDTGTQLINAYAMSQFVLHINSNQERFLEDNE